jgi:hypothetical protein
MMTAFNFQPQDEPMLAAHATLSEFGHPLIGFGQ